ncbi:hypothetical protein [uncultured Oscillibacter sp.]|uniref:hypothetical protein n=1 Tax=uncultured Oscillibacter sp. TaxID=876091 RepID=UPI00272DAABD|nr:hypothetical protein [uncultured Oscillibacter sp.]
MDKRTEVCKMRAGDLKTGFGNPRKISKKKLDELADSLEMLGDFGIYLIDEHDNIIGGNQRLKAVLRRFGPDTMLDCKRLIGYTEAELRAINIKDNTHAGEWDLDLLADWTADLNVSFGIDPAAESPQERNIQMMELMRYEKYDYVMIVCRNEIDYLQLTRALGIDDAKVLVAKKRKIRARAVWYDDMKAQIVKKPEDGKKNYDL